jgi:3-oxoacyl-[acyl-carrier protein] reductase
MPMNNARKVLITGSTRGIGLGTAQALANKGFFVYTNSRYAVKSLEGLSSTNWAHLRFDAEKRSAVVEALKGVAESESSLDCLICAVGSGSVRPVERSEAWEKNLSLNLISAVNVIEEALRIWSKTLKNILVISSIAGMKPMTDPPIEYSVAKAALNQFVKVKALELAPFGVNINAVLPGNILFPNSAWEKRVQSNERETIEYISNKVPLRRFGKISDVTEMVEFLLKPNSFVTGQLMVTDGGQVL